MSRSHSKVSLGNLFAWLLYCGAYLSILRSAVDISGPETPSVSLCCIVAVCWLLLLSYFVRRRHWGALIIHLVLVVPLPVLLILPDIGEQRSMRMVTATMWFASLLSFPISLVKLAEQAFRHDAPPLIYLAYNVVSTTTLLCVVCTILPSLNGRALHWPSATFGALIGLWAGLCLAVRNSPELRRARFAGISAHPFVAAGFWIGLAGSAMLWLLNHFVFTFPLLPVAFAPLIMGTLGALAVGAALRQASPKGAHSRS